MDEVNKNSEAQMGSIFLSDSFVGILKKDYDDKAIREERVKNLLGSLRDEEYDP